MGLLNIEGVTHWSIPVNNLDEAEAFYSEFLGLEAKGRLGNSRMSCVNVGDHNILLCELDEPTEQASQRDRQGPPLLHRHAGNLRRSLPCVQASATCPSTSLLYRERGFFTGRELYFFDPSGNRLELRDPTWEAGMPTPAFEDIN